MSTLNPDRIKSNHRKRIRVWIIAFLTGSVLMVWLVAELDLILRRGAVDRLPVMSYTTALINIITQPQLRKMYLLFELMFGAWIMYEAAAIGQHVNNIDTVMLTPDIEVPVKAGNGQHGAERFLTDEELTEKLDVFVYDGRSRPKLPGNGGIVVQMKKTVGRRS